MAKELVSIKGNMPARPTWYMLHSTVQIVVRSDEFEKLAEAVSGLQKSKAKRLLLDVSSVGGTDFNLTIIQD
jgi:hypothetical protein